MKVKNRTYYKALVLLVAFSLSTVVSFACSVSSLFHELHHHNSSAKSHHVHNHGVKHTHSHTAHHHGSDKPEEKKEDCCSGNVLQLQKTEKAVSRSIEAPNAVFAMSVFTAYASLLTLQQPEEKAFLPHHFRWRLPATIQDLRIVIQSFQI